jgi:Bax protein
MGFGLFSLVMITAVVVAAQTTTRGPMTAAIAPQQIPQNVSVDTTQALYNMFEASHRDWPPTGQQTVPPLVLTKLPEDFAEALQPDERRELFLRSLLPIVLIENRRLHEQRALAAWLLDGKLPVAGSPMRNWLTRLAKRYRVRGDLEKPAVRNKLLLRLDEIPPSLALAQAAIETGWGSSRFALEGNSLYGQWTFDEDKGLEPSQRDEDATHRVASFPDLRASVRAYMRNLNTGNAYHEFRTARAMTRAEAQPLNASELASHLHRYSQRGEDYVADIQQIIRSPAIAALNKIHLGRSTQTLAATLTATTDHPHRGG